MKHSTNTFYYLCIIINLFLCLMQSSICIRHFQIISIEKGNITLFLTCSRNWFFFNLVSYYKHFYGLKYMLFKCSDKKSLCLNTEKQINRTTIFYVVNMFLHCKPLHLIFHCSFSQDLMDTIYWRHAVRLTPVECPFCVCDLLVYETVLLHELRLHCNSCIEIALWNVLKKTWPG